MFLQILILKYLKDGRIEHQNGQHQCLYLQIYMGNIILQEALDKLRIATNCGYVLKMGPLTYHDKEKFPTGPWCKKGDWVIFARYAGSRLPIGEIGPSYARSA